MAWNISKAKRQALVKLQLRDKNGKFIEMGGGVKWYSSRLKKVVAGTVVGTKGGNALIRLNKENPTHEPALVSVPAHSIEPINSKGSLPAKGEKISNADTPEFEKPEAVGKVTGDDEEIDGDTESDHEKALAEVTPEDMAVMSKGTKLHSFKGEDESFVKQDGDSWENFDRDGNPNGSSTSKELKERSELRNFVFTSPEGETDAAPSDDDSADNYAISETSDGNTYISKKDGSELYSSARGLQVGDEVFAPAGADPTKPFSIGRNWATKGAERLNNDGVKIGKVIAVEGERYAVVQMAGGHTIPDRRNPDETTDTVTIGLANRVIKATQGLKDALGDKLGDTSYGDRPDDEDQEISDNDPLAQSDHVGREATPEQIAAEEAEDAETPEEPEAPKKVVGNFRISGAAKDELQFGIETQETDGNDPGLTLTGTKVEVHDAEAAIFTIDGPLGVLEDNLMGDVYKGSHKAIAKAKQRGLQKLRDGIAKINGSDDSKAEEVAPEAPAEAEAPKAHEAPSEAPEATEAPETPETPEAPAEEAPKAPEEAPKDEPAAEASTPAKIREAVAQIEQDIEDIDNNDLSADDFDAALEEAKRDIVGPNGEPYTIIPIRDAEGQWNYGLADGDGVEKGNWPSSEFEAAEIATGINDTINGNESSESAPEAAPAEEAAPEAPKAESYNENGLTEDEQRQVDASMRLAARSYDQFKDAEGDRYKAIADDLLAKGEERKNNPAAEAPAPAEVPSTAPESAPEPEVAPEVTPEPEAAPEAPKEDSEKPVIEPGSRVKVTGPSTTGTGSSRYYVIGKDDDSAYVVSTSTGNSDRFTPITDDNIGLNRFINKVPLSDVEVIPHVGASRAKDSWLARFKEYTDNKGSAPSSEFLNGYDINTDTGLRNLKKNDEDFDYSMDNTTRELVQSLPIGTVMETNDPERLDHGKPFIKMGENHWMEDPGFGRRDGFEIDHDDMYMIEEVPQGIIMPANNGSRFDPQQIERLRQRSDRLRNQSRQKEEAAKQESTPAPESTPEAAPVSAPQEPLVEGTQDEIKIPGVRKQGKRADKSVQHAKALDKLEEGDRVSHTNARGEKSTYLKHSDGTWDEIDPDDDFPEDSPIREAIPASEIADIHKRGDLKVTKAGEEEEPDAPAPAPEAAPAPEPTPEVAPEPEAAPESDTPFGITFERDASGLELPSASNPELLTPEESAEFDRLNGVMIRAQHSNHTVRERTARQDLEKLAQQVRDRNAAASESAPEAETPEEDSKKEATAPEAGQEPSDVQAPEFDDEPEEQEEVAPISDEQAGRVLESLTAENPLPAGIERHVPEAVEGEDYAPTQQQQDVIDAVLGGLDTLVQAKAGAGKTSTLRAIARRLKLARPDAKIGYIAFNKTVQVEANATMPNNTESRTGHSVAVAWAPEWMRNKLNGRNGFKSRPSDVANVLGIHSGLEHGGKAFSPNDQAMAAKKTVASFANSADDTITAEHLPDSVKAMSEANQLAIIDYANKAWQDMKDKKGTLKMSLDEIRKNWALSRPDFSKRGSGLSRPVSVLFLDEAQDTPPVLAKVIADQTIQKVIVGDADQAIYGFTGATDYLSNAEGDVELPLNKSWRFGPAVADMGNRFLQLVESPQRVVGGGESTIVDGMTDADAVLVRSNGGMFAEIARELENGRIVGVPGKTKTDLQNLIATAKYIRGEGGAPTSMHEDLENFRTWGEFNAEEEKGDNQNLSMIKRMINTLGLDKMEELIDKVVEANGSPLDAIAFSDHRTGLIAGGDTWGVASLTPRGERTHFSTAGFRYMEHPDGLRQEGGRNDGQPLKVWVATGSPVDRERKLARLRELVGTVEPDVVISTAHKSKGLEWDRVRIGDDFWAPKLDEDGNVVEMIKPEELRLNYVAVTRAAKELDLGSLAWVLDHTDENGGEVRNDVGTVGAPSLQSEDESVEKKSPVKQSHDEVAPEEAPVVESPETVPEEPEVVATPEAEAEPEAPAEEEVSPYNEKGLTETEQSTLDYAEGRLGRAQAGGDTARIDDLEREINGILSHGERRNAGETLGEYEPEEITDDEVEAPEPPVDNSDATPMGRRTRQSYSGVILRDSNGNDLAYGDIVGHRTRGPVQITHITASTGRIGFKVLKTGKSGTVEAHRVTRIGSGNEAATPDATPEVPSFDYPTTPGEVYVDPSSGKKAYIDASGNRMSIGDRVVETRTGKTGKIRGVYQNGQGQAWPRIDFDNGEDRRVAYTKVTKEGAPKAATAQDAPAPQASPAAPEAATTPATAPEIAPETAPEAPAVDTSFERDLQGESPAEAVARRLDLMRAAPAGSEINSTDGSDRFVKMDDGTWRSASDTDDEVLSLYDALGFVLEGEGHGRTYSMRHPSGDVAPAAPEVAPEAPVAAPARSGAIAPNTVPTASYYERKLLTRNAPIGTKVTRKDRPDDSWEKTGENDWTASDGRTTTDANLAVRMGNAYRDWTFNPDTPEESAPASGPVSTELRGNPEERAQLIRNAPVGSTMTSVNSQRVYTKRSPNEWFSSTGVTSMPWTDDELASVSDPTSARGVSTLTTPAGEAPAAEDPARLPAEAPNPVTHGFSRDSDERLAQTESLPVGTVLRHHGESYTKVSPEEWNDGRDQRYSNSDMAFEVNFGREDWVVETDNLPAESVAPAPFSGTLPSNRRERHEVLSRLPVGTIVTANNYTFEKTATNRWYTEQDANQPYDDTDVSWAGSTANPGVVTPFVEPTHDVTVPHDLDSNKHARRRSIQSAPIGSTITGANGRTYVKREEGKWDEITFGVNGYTENDIVALTTPFNGNAFNINPDENAGSTTGIHPALPVGTFLPNSEGSTSGLRKVDEGRWELMLNGQPTGRFSNDDNAQMMMDMNGTTPVAPVADTITKVDFGHMDYGVSDLGLGGKSFGDWMLDNRGGFSNLTHDQRQKIKDGYARFTADLNTRLPEGVEARQSGELYFSGGNLQHTMSFYKDGTHIGDATRDYNVSYHDDRTGERTNHVHHSLYQISDQGGGISSAFLKASKEFYRQLGIDRVTVMAALTVGGYAWARGGFDFDSRNSMMSAVGSWTARMPSRPSSGLSQPEYDALKAKWNALVARATPENYLNGTHPLPRDFADVGRPAGPTTKDTRWFGKDILKGSVWNGEFLLNPDRLPNPFLANNAGPVTEVAEAAPVGV